MLFLEKVPLKTDEIISVVKSESFALDYPYHIHPEFELIIILNASGKRFVGNHIGNFEGTDMAFLAPTLPHKWKFENTREDSCLLVLKFKELLLTNDIFYSDGCQPFNSFLHSAKQGLHFTNKSDILYCKRKLEKLAKLKGVDLVMASLQLIYHIYKIRDKQTLSAKTYSINIPNNKLNKIDNIYSYILENFNNSLSIENIANEFNLSKSGFCNFFKRHTGSNFSEFVNELRVSQACKMLIETTESVSSICFNTGFGNISYFNRKFKEITRHSPRSYRLIHE